MDSGVGGGGDGGGGEERDADLGPQASTLPFLTPAVIPERGSSSHTSAVAPPKEPPTPPQQEEEGPEGSPAGEEIQGGEWEERGPRPQENGVCQKRGMAGDFGGESLSGQRTEEGVVHTGAGEVSVTRGLPAALSDRREEEKEEEEAMSNQSQTKSKCSLLPQQSQHSSASSTAKASGTLDSKTAASPKPSPMPSSTPKPSTFLSTSPKHFMSSASSSALLSETEVKDIKGDQAWISGFPQSFKSQQSTLAFPVADTEPVGTPAEDDGLAGVSHSSISSGDGAKAPQPNDSQVETEGDDERDKEGEQKDAVLKNHELSPNSLTSHMTIMHSRNSCKTLKCPKCNWHYKSQHTLQVHMKEKHPETGGQCLCVASGGKCMCGGATKDSCGYCSSGKPHPRLARGETYACGYKPYRCEVCDYATSSKGNLSIHMQSDKHLHNIQNGGHANGHVHSSHMSNNGGSSNSHPVDEQTYKLQHTVPTSTVQPAKVTSPAHSHSHGKRWRCDVCDYETSIARNLRIHTTSEKHTHNMLRLQRGYYLSHCRSLAPQLKHLQSTGGELSLNVRLSGQQVPEQPVTIGSTLTPSPSPSPSPPPAPSLSPTGPLSLGVFQCLVCSCFSSDSLESVEQHLNVPRSLPQSNWCSLVAGGCHCRLCGYTTPLRANFSLHCQTDRHRTRYQLAAHLQEGGDRGQEGAALIAKGNPVQLRCNLCDYVTSSLEKLRGHSLSSHHKASTRVYRFLQQYDGEVDGGSWLFHCLLCNHSSSSKLQLLKHSQNPTHQQREGLLQLQPMGGEELAAIFTIRKSSDTVTGEASEAMETSSETTAGPLDQTKDACNLGLMKSSEDAEETLGEERETSELLPSVKRPSSECGEKENCISTKRPRTHQQQNENQQTVQCPLCQVKVPYIHLRQHLTHVHSVAQDCVDKLISAVTPSMEQLQAQPETELQTETDSCPDDTHKNKNSMNNSENCSDSHATVKSQKNKGISVENTEEDVAAPKDVTALLTPPLEDTTPHPSNGRLAPRSPTHTSPSSPPASPSSDPPPLSDRHGYRFRCSRCSLAFPTQEKLQLHWQYHAMRAATECPLCSRQCRSQEALQRHMQNTHSQLDNTQNTLITPHTTQEYMENNKSPGQQEFGLSPQVGQEAEDVEDQDMEEEGLGMEEKKEEKGEGEIKEKDIVVKLDGGENNLTEPDKGSQDEKVSERSSSSLVKKTFNPTMDRYLDPSRPYKCTICSESFTQKTILLVHYNSVSHLHRARRALQDSGQGPAAVETPRGPDPRPYRCRLCGVGYSQSSTLDIHLRSVLHQTRARAAQNPASQAQASSTTPTIATQDVVTREETSKSLPFSKRSDMVNTSASSLLGPSLAVETHLTLSGQTDSQQAQMSVEELLASRNQLMLIQQQQLAQAQAHAQAQLQQHTALLHSQMIQHLSLAPENLLKQHFPLASDNLLTLQQQLLLPFYLSPDNKLNSDLATSPERSQVESSSNISKEQFKPEARRDSPVEKEKQKQTQCSNVAVGLPNDRVQCEANIDAGCDGALFNHKEKENASSLEETIEEMSAPTVKTEEQKEETNASSLNILGLQCPPPRVPYAAVNGEPLRALLQCYGYEMALQYIQNRHRHQQQITTQMINNQDFSINKNEVCSREERNELSQPHDGNVTGFNIENKQETEVNVQVESMLFDKNQNKQDESTHREKRCCGRREKCRDCGKIFSDALILKSHQEYIHRLLFPTAALERFSKEYRLHYDQMYPLTQHKIGESLNADTQSEAPATSSESEPVLDPANTEIKNPTPSPAPLVSDPVTKKSSPATELTQNTPAPSPPPSPSEPGPVLSQQQEIVPSTSATATPLNTSPAKAISLALPKIPMLPLPLPQLPIPPLPLPKLPLPPIPFPMDLPLLPPVLMQSVALQSQPWLESSVNPELAKHYQSQLSPALLGQQPQLSPALLPQQPQLSPTLLGQPQQRNSALLGQPSQPSPNQAGQQPQVSPTLPEQQQCKRTRTRISEEQLTVLRKHFDINSLPSDEEVNKMSALSGLPHKVIKHWFRNTLFKERQRDKDSPYNFNNPPITALEESRGEVTQNQLIECSPSSVSPGLPVNSLPQPQTSDLQRGEPSRGRRSSRTRFTEKQLETLQGVFEATPYPREEEYDRLSALLSLPNRVIVVWFQNARQRARKNQDRGTDDGLEGRNHNENIYRQRNGCSKSDNCDDDNEDNGCQDGQSDCQNENSMDLTYEYYTHPDSPEAEASPHCTETETMHSKGEPASLTTKQEEKTTSVQATMNQPLVQTHTVTPDAEIQQKVTIEAMQTLSHPQPESQLDPEISPERPQPHPTCSSQITVTTISSTSNSKKGHTNSLPCDLAVEKPVSSSLPSPPQAETNQAQLPDVTSGPCIEMRSQTQIQPQNQAQFQCSFCPISLPTFQLWQEHQTRHLLAAQSQVQLLHSSFTDRPMPYMMLHPNHTLMASQMLTGAMSQLHQTSTHPMISQIQQHTNSTQMKNTLSDHSSNSLTSLSPTSLLSMKQSSKLIPETSLEAQRDGREVEEEQRRDKRQRTTITPEQLEVLYQRYSLDSNPTRGVLESIAQDVGLTRRVVQVWFQNTRARERKGQFRSMGAGSSFILGLNHLRCPFCRALFKVKSALDAHMRSRHWAEAEKTGYNLSMSNVSNGHTGSMAASSVMDRPGPSVSSNSIPKLRYVISHKDLSMKFPLTSLFSTTDMNNPEEDEEYDEEEEYPYEEGSGMVDQGSLTPEGSGELCSDWSETQIQQRYHQQQQRQRTQMTHFQVLQLRDFYRTHRTPSRHECEALGQELGLPVRVVQVWFQNARAKEKRARSLSSDSTDRDQAELTAGAGERDRA